MQSLTYYDLSKNKLTEFKLLTIGFGFLALRNFSFTSNDSAYTTIKSI